LPTGREYGLSQTGASGSGGQVSLDSLPRQVWRAIQAARIFRRGTQSRPARLGTADSSGTAGAVPWPLAHDHPDHAHAYRSSGSARDSGDSHAAEHQDRRSHDRGRADVQPEARPQHGAIFHPKGRGNGYVVSLGGTRVYIGGDTGCTPEMRALTDIELAFVPMNLPYTMSPDEAAACVKAMKHELSTRITSLVRTRRLSARR
jgi:hypothetical protein